MKRVYIWILTGIVAICFIGLLLIQSLFVTRMAHERNDLFDQIVTNCMTRVILNLETEEYMYEEDNQLQQSWDNTASALNIGAKRIDFSISDKSGNTNFYGTIQQQTISSYTKPELNIKKDDSNDFAARQRANFDKQYGRYQQKQTRARKIDWLIQAEEKSLEERMQVEKLLFQLETEFHDNGINLPFYVSVVNHKGDTVFNNKSCFVDNHKANYKRHLFPNDIHPKAHFISVYFPDKRSYIYQSMNFATPALIIATTLIMSIIIMIYVLFKQKRLSEIKNDFINNMTHEFKTPISTISLASQMLKDTGVSKTPQSLGHISRVIHDETKRLGFQVEKVLQMAIFDRDKSRLKLTGNDINELIHSVITNFSIKVENKGGAIVEELNANPSFLQVDELHFTNVIFNLLDNALKYCHREPHLEIKTWNEKQKVCISVKDNGIGIKKDDLKRVFEKFYRVPTGNVHNVKGFGLGLAYVKKIVDDHNGTIRVDSEINTGTTFIICLPLKSPQ